MPTPCSDISKLVPTYLDGELAETELLAFEHHLAECDDCESEVGQEREFLDTVRSALATPPAPDTLRARLSKQIDREEAELARSESRARRAWLLPGTASIAAAAALLVFILDLAQPTGNDNRDEASFALSQSSSVQPNPVAVSSGSRDIIDQSAREFLRIPVRSPRFTNSNASLEGWKPMRKRGRLSALFVYQVSTSGNTYRLEVQTLDARNLDLRSAERQVVNGTEFWVTRTPGVSAVTYRDNNGVAYIFTSHMDTDDLVDLVVNSDAVERINRRLHRR